MSVNRRVFSAALAAPLAGATVPALAQGSYPERAVRVIVPYPAGGFNDTLARVVGKKLQDVMGQPFIADNKPGGGTIIGTDAAIKSAPDGYTLFIASFPTVVNQFLYKNLPYSVQRDIAPITLAGYAPNLLVVRADAPYKTARDLVAAAKAAPGRLNYASAGNGTSLHLAMEYFKNVTGTNITHIPYKGSAPMITDLLGGQVDVMFDNLPNVLPHIQSGRMRTLGVTSLKRLPGHPEIPTIAEQGYPGFEISPWYGIAAPAGTPRAILTRLNAEIGKILVQADVKAIFAAQGVEMVGGSIDDFDRYIKAQSARWEPIVRNANIQLD